MFKHAPSEAFKPDSLALPPPLDFYTESAQVSSAEEDLAHSTDISIMLADFGTASWFERHLTEWIQPQMLRAPEVILEANWDHKVDIWNLGLIDCNTVIYGMLTLALTDMGTYRRTTSVRRHVDSEWPIFT
ncbi:Serine/threonine-protein kinase SRPK [Metarhizium anisopliae]